MSHIETIDLNVARRAAVLARLADEVWRRGDAPTAIRLVDLAYACGDEARRAGVRHRRPRRARPAG